MAAKTQKIKDSTSHQRMRYFLLRLAIHEVEISLAAAVCAADQVELTWATSHSWVLQIITCCQLVIASSANDGPILESSGFYRTRKYFRAKILP